jgi:hypothetical protein
MQICQWGMTLYAAIKMTDVSPAIIITFGTICFLLNIVDNAMDVVARRRGLRPIRERAQGTAHLTREQF